MSIVQIVTLDITQLDVHNHIKRSKHIREKTAEAVILQTGSTITEKEQPLCNTHLKYNLPKYDYSHFSNQAQGDSRSRISPRN